MTNRSGTAARTITTLGGGVAQAYPSPRQELGRLQPLADRARDAKGEQEIRLSQVGHRSKGCATLGCATTTALADTVPVGQTGAAGQSVRPAAATASQPDDE
jgi:hypothetical protein